MKKNTETQPRSDPHSETTEELVGVLTAISVVSKRLARRLVLLDEPHGEGGEADGKRKKHENADKGDSV